MADRHLNLFFSYSQDTDLLENNLTRAWIVTMQLLSSELRERLLHKLLGEALRALGNGLSNREHSFATAQFALQGHMDSALVRSCSDKYLVAMASEHGYDDDSSEGRESPRAGQASGSIPDAWIFDKAGSYCFLVEAKVGTNPLDDGQIANHATRWFGLPRQELATHLLALSWDDLANVLEGILSDIAGGRLAALVPEQLILTNLSEYLTFFGYRAFRGIALNAVQDIPAFALGRRGIHLPALARLGAPPGFRLQN